MQGWWYPNAVLVAMLGAENHLGMIYRLRVITEQMIRRGRFHVCSVRDI